MQTSDWLMILAVLLAPIIAVQVSQYLERKRQRKEEKLRLFKTLMATRATNLAHLHVEALNMIDVAFYGGSKKDHNVVSSWKVYLDHLNDVNYPKDSWDSKRKELFVDLMHTMAISVGFDFDKSHIKNTSYYPSGHGDVEDDQFLLRKGLLGLLKGKISLPITITEPKKDESA